MAAASALTRATLFDRLGGGRVGEALWRDDQPICARGDTLARSPTPGPALAVDVRVTDRDGRPVAGAEVDVWHSSPEGLYENQDPAQAEMNLPGRFMTDAAGCFSAA